MVTNSPFFDRVATAPISWGVCEVPGWGVQLPAEQVLAEMGELGFRHTELGSIGYLPTEPDLLRTLLGRFDLELLGGFVPLVLHDADRLDQARVDARTAADLLAGAGAQFFVTAVVPEPDDWHRRELTADEWQVVYGALGEIESLCVERGLQQVVHPHVNTIVEQVGDVDRILNDTSIALCLDTAHLIIGGADPLALVRQWPDRIGLVHLKDIDEQQLPDLQNEVRTLMECVQSGIFPPLGRGSVPIAEIVTALELDGHQRWYVVEQDTAITDENPSALAGPKVDVRESIDFLRGLDVVDVS